jgi:hypothetical protein
MAGSFKPCLSALDRREVNLRNLVSKEASYRRLEAQASWHLLAPMSLIFRRLLFLVKWTQMYAANLLKIMVVRLSFELATSPTPILETTRSE